MSTSGEKAQVKKSRNTSTAPSSAKSFKERAREMADLVVENLNRNAVEDCAKTDKPAVAKAK
jgi:hypothetical protein